MVWDVQLAVAGTRSLPVHQDCRAEKAQTVDIEVTDSGTADSIIEPTVERTLLSWLVCKTTVGGAGGGAFRPSLVNPVVVPG